jgi:hypothetical protein
MQDKNIIMPVILNECENWSLTLREEHKLSVFENKVLRRIFGPKRDEVTGELRRLYEEEHNDLYSSPNIILVIKLGIMRLVGACRRHGGDRRGAYSVFVRESKGNR